MILKVATKVFITPGDVCRNCTLQSLQFLHTRFCANKQSLISTGIEDVCRACRKLFAENGVCKLEYRPEPHIKTRVCRNEVVCTTTVYINIYSKPKRHCFNLILCTRVKIGVTEIL